MMTPQDDRDRIITTSTAGGGRRRWKSDSGSGGPLPAIGPSSFRAAVSSGGGNHSTVANAGTVAHQNSINHQRAGSGGGGYARPSHGDVDNPISAKLNLTTSPSSERRRKKTNKQHPEQRIRKHEKTHPTVDATKLLQR
uniref:Uncharacterized protein n=1 Tax=Anopheles funestus TaxID=62324 RepID=A0A4Y0BI56_ANOFN